MITLTKEWLLKTIAELEEERDSMPGVVNEDAAMALAAMKLALASIESEPVAFRSKLKPPSAIGSEHWDYKDHRQPDAFELESCVIERLFTEPPAPISVPDEEQCKPHPVMAVKGELGFLDHFDRIISERDEDIDIGQLGSSNYEALMLAALDAFRAAMLQGADGNSPAIPGGWVACSERMPETMVSVLVTGTWFHHAVAFWDGLSWCDIDFEQPVTHWMPLPAAPQ
nr:MAG TPA: Protein of unknown function (DUF551) [Caudoviricetes sp.]